MYLLCCELFAWILLRPPKLLQSPSQNTRTVAWYIHADVRENERVPVQFDKGLREYDPTTRPRCAFTLMTVI